MSTTEKTKKRGITPLLLAIIFGLCVGTYLRFYPSAALPWALEILEFPGQIFLNYLKLLVIPLIFTSVITGLADLSSTKGQKKLTQAIILLVSSGLAITFFLALTLSLAFCPELIQAPDLHPQVDTLAFVRSTLRVVYKLVPTNIVHSLGAKDGLIGVLSFSLIMGFVASKYPKETQPFIKPLKSLQSLIIKMFPHCLVNIGIFSIVAHKLATEKNLEGVVWLLGKFIAAEGIGFVIICFVILPIYYFLFTHKNPFTLLKQMKKPLIFSAATASSTGSIPYTLKALEEGGIDPRLANFYIPFGSALNIWGSGFHKPCVIFFLMTLSQTPLTLELMVLLFLLCLIFATGGAGIPSGSILVIPEMLGVIGIPYDFVKYLLPIDWLMDRLRTPANVLGDAYGAAILHHLEHGKQKKS